VDLHGPSRSDGQVGQAAASDFWVGRLQAGPSAADAGKMGQLTAGPRDASTGQAGSGGTGRVTAFGPPTALQADWVVRLWLSHLHFLCFHF
jgi:hypothetical protein